MQFSINQKILSKEIYQVSNANTQLIESILNLKGESISPLVEVTKGYVSSNTIERTYFLNKTSLKIEEIKNNWEDGVYSSVEVIEL